MYFYVRISTVLKWKTLLPHKNFPNTALGWCSILLNFIYSHFKILKWREIMVAIFKSLLTKVKPTPQVYLTLSHKT